MFFPSNKDFSFDHRASSHGGLPPLTFDTVPDGNGVPKCGHDTEREGWGEAEELSRGPVMAAENMMEVGINGSEVVDGYDKEGSEEEMGQCIGSICY